MNHTHYSSERGFTLTELIISVGVLLVLVLYGALLFRGEQAKARDAERIADMRTAQAAFAVLYNETNSYQDAAVGCNTIADPLSSCALASYLPGLTALEDPGRFTYRVIELPDSTGYRIEFVLERGYDGLPAGIHYLTPIGLQ
ncbi:MAG: prepilin-type N-terminal cleavage/methylation domain-containing protein [Patescibacteria group bacterium]